MEKESVGGKMNNNILIIVLVISFLVIPVFSETGKEVEIIVEIANIRSQAGAEGDIIQKAKMGDNFKILGLEGSWYKIALPIDKKGDPEFGYIHTSIVKIKPDEVKKAPPPPPPSDKKIKKIAKKPKEVKLVKKKNSIKFYQDKLFSGFYLKAGTITSPKIDSFGDKWIIALGFDKAIGKYMAWGIEFQPFYRNFSDESIDLSMHNLSMNVFVNFKAGINLGKFFEPLKLFTLYGGLGVGSSLSFSYIDIAGVTGSDFNVMFAWHYMFGSEIALGKMNLILEIQGVKVIDPDIDPSTMSLNYFMLGIRF